MNNTKKEMYLIEVVNVVAWANQLTPEKLNKIDFKVRWALKKSLAKLAPDANEFESMRNDALQSIQTKWFSEEYSEPYKDGDDPANEETRKVKDEYLDEYKAEVDELNAKINEVLSEKSTYEIYTADIDSWVNSLDSLEPLEFNDIEILDALLSPVDKA